MKSILFHFLVFLAISSCAPGRKLSYFNDLDATNYEETIKRKPDDKIQPDDILSIKVSSLSPESNALFNSGVISTGSSNPGAASATGANDGYLVNANGTINFPILGKVAVAGFTKEQITEKLTLEIRKSVKNPTVNIRLINFKVTVIGEVNHPSTFTITNEKINLIELLGLAGDLTVYGKRNNILVIREQNGIRNAFRINLESKDVFKSPAFYLQQNDIVYIEPIKTKSIQTSSFTTYMPIVSFAVTLLSVVLFLFR